MSNELETEVKFRVRDLEAIRGQLLAAGAEGLQARVREVNLRFDTPDMALSRTGRVLRLRSDTGIKLTLKLPVGPWSREAKTLRELEVELGDLKTGREILEGLGYRVWLIYEKNRESLALEGATVCLDELPFGTFIEIEGSLAQIDSVATLLGLEERQRITAGYVGLFLQLKERLNLPFEHCTFADWRSFERQGPGRTHVA